MATNHKLDPANIPGAIVEKEGPRENFSHGIGRATTSPDTDLEALLQSAEQNAVGTQYGSRKPGSGNSGAGTADADNSDSYGDSSPSGTSGAQPVGANNEL